MVTGDLDASGGELARAQGAVVEGRIVEGGTPADVLGSDSPPASPVERAAWTLGSVLAAAAIAWILTRLFPCPVRRVAAASTGFPLVSGALGTLVLITVLPLVVAMAFTLFLIPLAVVVLILSGATLAYGGIGLGLGLGKRILRRAGREGPDAVAAALGTAVLVAALQLLGLVPLVGVLAAAVAAVVAAGAVVLTAFGLRRYTPPDDVVDEPATER